MTGSLPGMLRDLALWWAEQMRDLLPASMRRSDRAAAPGLVVTAESLEGDAPVVALGQRRGRAETPVGRFRLDEGGVADARRALSSRPRPRAITLRLPGTLLLEREVSLPAAAEREAERVLTYEMDRLTPFSAAEVLWTWSVAARDRARGRTSLRLSLVPRAAVAGVLAALDRVGLAPTLVAVQAADGAPRLIALDHDGQRAGAWRRGAVSGLTVLCATLAVAVVATPFVLQSMRLSAVESRIEAARPNVARAEQLRRRIAGEQAGADVVAAERARTGDVLEVLATLTDVLPDDTWLTDLTLNQGKLGLAGQSAAAAKLISALAAEPALRNPTFIAPVTRTETGGADLFSIRAEVSP